MTEEEPHGWRKQKTDDGEIYYFNFDSGESLWEPPLGFVDPDDPNSVPAKEEEEPHGWRKQQTDEGEVYFFNFDSGESLWEPPPGFVDPDAQPTEVPQEQPTEEKVAEVPQEEEPHCWRKQKTDEGEIYYFNFDSGESLWEPPPGFVDPDAPAEPVNAEMLNLEKQKEDLLEELHKAMQSRTAQTIESLLYQAVNLQIDEATLSPARNILVELQSEEQAKTEEEAKLAAEKAAEEEERLAAERAEEEERLQAQKAEEEERLQAEKAQAEEEARIAAEKESEEKAAEEARLAAEKEAQEASLAAEKESEEKAAEEAKLAAEEEAKLAAEEEAKLATEKEAQAEEEATRLAAEKESEEKAEEEAKLAAEKEAQEARLAAEKEAQEARLAAEKEAQEARLAAEKEAQEARLAAEKKKKDAEKAEADRKAREKKVAEEKAKAEQEKKLAAEKQKAAEVKKVPTKLTSPRDAPVKVAAPALSGDRINLKVVVIGESRVGKTALLNQYCSGTAVAQYKATKNVESYSKDLVVDGKNVTLHLFEIGGSQKLQSIPEDFWKGIFGAVLVIDITSALSFDSISKRMVKSLLDVSSPKAPAKFPFVLISNKSDCAATRQVTSNQISTWCFDKSITYFETSVKEVYGIDAPFSRVAKLAFNYKSIDETTAAPQKRVMTSPRKPPERKENIPKSEAASIIEQAKKAAQSGSQGLPSKAPPGKVVLKPTQGGVPTKTGVSPVKTGTAPVKTGVPPKTGTAPVKPGATAAKPGTVPVKTGVPPKAGTAPVKTGMPPKTGTAPVKTGGVPVKTGVPPKTGTAPVKTGVPPKTGTAPLKTAAKPGTVPVKTAAKPGMKQATAPAAKPSSDKCTNYRLDMNATQFGVCVCGKPKAAHS